MLRSADPGSKFIVVGVLRSAAMNGRQLFKMRVLKACRISLCGAFKPRRCPANPAVRGSRVRRLTVSPFGQACAGALVFAAFGSGAGMRYYNSASGWCMAFRKG